MIRFALEVDAPKTILTSDAVSAVLRIAAIGAVDEVFALETFLAVEAFVEEFRVIQIAGIDAVLAVLEELGIVTIFAILRRV